MSDPDRPDDENRGLLDYAETYGDAEFVGATAGGVPVYYHRDERTWLEGTHGPDEDPQWSSRETLPEDREVGDRIRDVHEESGWERLSDWAREHVPGFGDGEGGATEDDRTADR